MEKEKKKKARMYEKEIKVLGIEREKEEAERNRVFELEKIQIKNNSPHGLRKGGVKEDTVKSQMV